MGKDMQEKNNDCPLFSLRFVAAVFTANSPGDWKSYHRKGVRH